MGTAFCRRTTVRAADRPLAMILAGLAVCGVVRAGESAKTVLDLKEGLWQVRQIRGTPEYLTRPGQVERVVYRPKKGDLLRKKAEMEEGDYTVEKAPEYLLPDDTGPDWMKPDYDDSQWLRVSGPGAVGFGDEGGKLILVRGWFPVADPARCEGMTLSASYRGGLVAYLNGEEIARQDMMAGPGGLSALGEPYPEAAHLRPDGRVLTAEEGAKKAEWTRTLKKFKIPAGKFRKGANLLAVALHRAPLDKVCLLRPNGQGQSVALGAGGPVGWPTVGLSDLQLVASAGTAAGEPSASQGLRAWNHNIGQNLPVRTSGVPGAPLQPVRLAAPRNGIAAGVAVVGAPAALRGIGVKVGDMKGPGAIPAAAIQVRYMLPDGQTPMSRRDERGPTCFDTLAEAAPPEVAVNAQSGLAVQPLWIGVRVPESAKPGDYRGALTVSAEGQAPVTIPLALRVGAWALPPVSQYSTHMDFFQSPDSVAMRYGVEMWSDAHLKLLDRTFGLLAPLGTKSLYITAVRRTHMGNEHAMVQWKRGAEGGLEPDLSVVETYLDVARKHLGPVPSVVLYAWEPPYSQGHAGNPNSPGRQHDRPILLTLQSDKTGKRRAITGPEWGTPESRELWAKLTRALQKSLADRGMADSLLFGIMGDHRPTKAAMDEIANAAPTTKWSVHSHFSCLEHHGYKVGLCAAVWGIGCNPYLPDFGESGYGWKSEFRLVLNSRYDLRTWSPVNVWMTLPEKWLSAKAGGRGSDNHPLNGTKGMGRMGADFWLVAKDGRGEPNREPLCGRYPESAWGQLSLNNCAISVLAPGPEGPLATARSEGLRECVQAMEARVVVERALLNKEMRARLGDDLASRCQALIDNRRRAAWYGGDFFAGSDWLGRAGQLYDLAQEVTEKTAAGKP